MGASPLGYYDDFRPRDIELLERKLAELQAKMRRASELLDERHALIMAHEKGATTPAWRQRHERRRANREPLTV